MYVIQKSEKLLVQYLTYPLYLSFHLKDIYSFIMCMIYLLKNVTKDFFMQLFKQNKDRNLFLANNL